MTRSPLVIGIFGPTASGKSAVAEGVAERLGGEVVSADSMQVYRGLPILTNQPARPTRLVAIWDLDHEASVGEFARLAHAEIDGLLAGGLTPIVAGGTGLYFRAALAELELPPAPTPGARERWEALYDLLGGEVTHRRLAGVDEAAARAIHPNDRRRVVRALELAESGRSLRPDADRLWGAGTRQPTLVATLDVPPAVLTSRIEERTRRMFELGVAEEARRALAAPLSRTARHVIGVEEAAALPRDEAIAAIVARTRRYAAYQRKWLRRIPGAVSLAADRPPGELADEILEMARARQRVPARRAG
ncbi:MAG: tRNA (adenosine(37)-N6)-dimethylallyltransferase MiaA [Thermoleophilia bacterium]|nr:tRNA (adenosine(37)-N6)-dimethylallyltransferase MiaA [Thermoleophilia bacterium]